MSDEARLDRHYELWQQESASVGRWVFGTLLFAVVVLLRVIGPYVETSHTLTQDRGQLSTQTTTQAAEQARLEQTERLATGVEKLYEDISRSPWQGSVDELKRDLERLGEAYRMLSVPSPAELAEALARSPRPEVEVSQFEQVLPRRSRDSGRRGRRSDPLELLPLTPWTAAGLLSLDAAAVGGLSPAELSALLEQRLKAAAQERADATVNEIAELVRNRVVGPLERLLGDSEQTQLGQALVPIVQRLEDGMMAWNRALLADAHWYRTVARKDSVVRGLNEELETYQRDFRRASTAARERLSASIGERKRLLRVIKAEIQALEKTTAHLAEVLDTALPEWIRGFVSPQQMIQLYPPALVLLVIVLVFKTGRARRHFLTVRDHRYPDGAYRQDAALSSTWTLVYRGVTGTLVTAVAFIGCALLLLWFFEGGTAAALEWFANHPGTGWADSRSWLERLRPVGWILMLGAACAAVLVLLVDGRAALRARS